MPSRTDTKYFAKIFPFIDIIYFFQGRLKYNDGKGVAPFPTMILKLSNKNLPNVVPYALCITVKEFIEKVQVQL